MGKSKAVMISLMLSFGLVGCSTSNAQNLNNNDDRSESRQTEVSRQTEMGSLSDIETESESFYDESSSTETEGNMQNIELGTVPNEYYSAAKQQGTLESFVYDTKDYIGDGKTIQSQATVYLPYGYDQNDKETRYNILYLQHGAYGNERTWMYEYGDKFKNMIDNMIENKQIPPLIIVMPYLPSGNEWYHDTTLIFYSDELKNDLMPAVESFIILLQKIRRMRDLKSLVLIVHLAVFLLVVLLHGGYFLKAWIGLNILCL